MRTLFVLLLASNAVACNPGCAPYQGTCACEERPEQGPPVKEVKPSDEKPSRHPEPAYQRGEVHVSDGLKERASADKQDQAIIDAQVQGKKAAGIK